MGNCMHGHNKQRNRKTFDTSCSEHVLLYHLTLKYAEIIQDWNWGTSASQIKVQQKIYIKCSLILNYTQTKNKICICESIKTVQSPPKVAVKTLSCFQGNQPKYGTNRHVVWTKYLTTQAQVLGALPGAGSTNISRTAFRSALAE